MLLRTGERELSFHCNVFIMKTEVSLLISIPTQIPAEVWGGGLLDIIVNTGDSISV